MTSVLLYDFLFRLKKRMKTNSLSFVAFESFCIVKKRLKFFIFETLVDIKIYWTCSRQLEINFYTWNYVQNLTLTFSGEDIMDGIPVLEIDCNMEFHDDEAMKKKMLDQVITDV